MSEYNDVGYHQCDVSKSDLSRAVDDIRYDLERKIDGLKSQVSRLERQIESLGTDVAGLYSSLRACK